MTCPLCGANKDQLEPLKPTQEGKILYWCNSCCKIVDPNPKV